MVSQGKNNDLPDKDTLRRYLQGKLPPEEAHRIEKLILNNPLYQDALDGLETLNEEEMEQDLKNISQQINERTQTTSKGTKINFYRIAAAVILLAAFSYIIVYTTSRMGEVSKNETLSQKQEVRDEVEQVPAEAQVEESAETASPEKPLETTSPEEHVETPSPQKSREVLAVAVTDESREEATLDEIEDSDFREKEEELSLAVQEQDPEMQDPRSAVARTDEEKLIENQDPCSAVARTDEEKLIENQDPRSAVARTNEEKLMGIQDEDLESLSREEEGMRVKSSGQPAPEMNDYQESDSDKRKENKLARQGDSQAAKVPEAAYEPLANAEIKAEGSLKPVPVEGFEIYTKYISENLKYPPEDLEKKNEGTVILGFIINKDSIPDKIRIVQSLSPDCDKEAKRLLREGPKWIPAYKDGELHEIEMEYNIYFQTH